jgi:hypothetical protein
LAIASANQSRRERYPAGTRQCPEQIALRPHDADLPVGNLDALRQGAEVVASVAASGSPHPAPRGFGEGGARRRCDGLAGAIEHGRRAVSIDLRLSARVADPLLQALVVQLGDAVLDGIVQALEPSIGRGGLAASLGQFHASVQQRTQTIRQSLGIKGALLRVAGDQVIEPPHRH